MRFTPAIYVALHSYPIKRAFSQTDGPKFDKVVWFEPYLPSIFFQGRKLFVYCKSHYMIMNKETNKNRMIKDHEEYVDFLWRKSLDDAKAASLHEQKNLEMTASDKSVGIFELMADQNQPFWSMGTPVLINEGEKSLIKADPLEVEITEVDGKPQKPYRATGKDLERLFALHDRLMEKITERVTPVPIFISPREEMLLDDLANALVLPRRRIAPVPGQQKPGFTRKKHL